MLSKLYSSNEICENKHTHGELSTVQYLYVFCSTFYLKIYINMSKNDYNFVIFFAELLAYT